MSANFDVEHVGNDVKERNDVCFLTDECCQVDVMPKR